MIRFWEPTPEEYEAAKDRALRSLGITYAELAEQARRRDFSSSRAHLLWVAIGGETHPANPHP